MADLVAPAATEVTATATGSTGKPFNCTVAGCNSKGFMRRYELERHMRKHNRTEVFPCPVGSCPFSRQTKAFYRRDKLQSHLRKVHPGQQAAGNGIPSGTVQAQGHA
ncbi:Krueppel-like factor 16 [Diplodia seriata]|nr:Krueppel-like factor 16 [Diplodia seriata]